MKKKQGLHEVVTMTEPRKTGEPVVLGEISEKNFEATLRALGGSHRVCMPTHR